MCVWLAVRETEYNVRKIGWCTDNLDDRWTGISVRILGFDVSGNIFEWDSVFKYMVHDTWVSFLLVYVFFVKETWIFYKLLANYYLRIDLVGRRWKSWSPGEWYLVRDFECQARWCEDPSRLTSNIDLIEYPLFERSCAIIGTQQTTSKRFSFKSIYDTLQMSR